MFFSNASGLEGFSCRLAGKAEPKDLKVVVKRCESLLDQQFLRVKRAFGQRSPLIALYAYEVVAVCSGVVIETITSSGFVKSFSLQLSSFDESVQCTIYACQSDVTSTSNRVDLVEKLHRSGAADIFQGRQNSSLSSGFS